MKIRAEYQTAASKPLLSSLEFLTKFYIRFEKFPPERKTIKILKQITNEGKKLKGKEKGRGKDF